MKLSLYKTPYVDPLKPGLVRLLFEGRFDEHGTCGQDEFYVYLWLTKKGIPDGFQVVCGETIAVTWQRHGSLSWGTLSRQIINRGITGSVTEHDHSWCTGVLETMSSEEFPEFIDFVKRIISGLENPSFKPTRKELKLFRRLNSSL